MKYCYHGPGLAKSSLKSVILIMATFINLLRSHHPLSLKASHVDNENDALNVPRLSAEKRWADRRLVVDSLWLISAVV